LRSAAIADQRRWDLLALKELLERGKVRPAIERCYELSEVPDAIRYLETGHASGKLVVAIRR
jgi:NADPH:quinone reductase-like Zn-dependent oxidoreductase